MGFQTDIIDLDTGQIITERIDDFPDEGNYGVVISQGPDWILDPIHNEKLRILQKYNDVAECPNCGVLFWNEIYKVQGSEDVLTVLKCKAPNGCRKICWTGKVNDGGSL